jgi:hypothetical protein
MEALFNITLALFDWIHVWGDRGVRHKDNAVFCPEPLTAISC